MDNQDQTIYMREMPHHTSSFEKGKKRKQENKRTKSVGTLADCEWRAAAPLAARPATIVCYYLAKGWRAQEATTCGWESRYLCLYCSCPVKDNSPRATIIRVEDSEVNYLLTHRAFGVAVPC